MRNMARMGSRVLCIDCFMVVVDILNPPILPTGTHRIKCRCGSEFNYTQAADGGFEIKCIHGPSDVQI